MNCWVKEMPSFRAQSPQCLSLPPISLRTLQLPRPAYQICVPGLHRGPLTLMSGNWPRYVSMVSSAWSTSFWW